MRRFNRKNSCPVCDGHVNLRQGQGVRCAGFLNDAGDQAFCTREEYAGQLPPRPTLPVSYRHILCGKCGCGGRHQ